MGKGLKWEETVYHNEVELFVLGHGNWQTEGRFAEVCCVKSFIVKGIKCNENTYASSIL